MVAALYADSMGYLRAFLLLRRRPGQKLCSFIMFIYERVNAGNAFEVTTPFVRKLACTLIPALRSRVYRVPCFPNRLHEVFYPKPQRFSKFEIDS